MFVKCIICFGELKRVFVLSSLKLALLTHEASPNSKTLKRATLNCPNSVNYHLELHVIVTSLSFFYQVSYIMFFDVHTKYLCSLRKSHTLATIQ